MSLSITEFPQDILLELAKRLDVADLLSLLSLCRITRGLQCERTLWLDALIRIKENIVRRVDRLRKNFKSEKPRPFHIGNFSVEGSASTFFIPGANLIVVHTNKGSVSCWDTVTSQRVAHLNNEKEWFYIQPNALCTEIKGKALIGAWIRDGDLMRLAVICIDFRDRARISISQVISPTNVRHSVPHLFINPQVMGFCTMTDIVSWNMNADVAVQSTPDAFIQAIPSRMRAPCLAFGQTLYLFFGRAGGSSATVRSLPFPPLSASDIQPIPSDHPGPNTTTLSGSNVPEFRVHGGGFSGTIDKPRLFAPRYGIFAVASLAGTVSLDMRRADSTSKLNLITFWPGHADRGSDNIEFGPGCFYQHPDHILEVAVGDSGTHVLFLVRQEPYREPYLGLVHFVPLPVPHTTFRKLDTGDVTLSSCIEIVLDDSLGLVAIMDEERQVTTISYV
ncbi:hypothetical protein B0H13DRAFT_2026331 [Mycena leptocephala]|nr:hypothetical protein B0H13DRAFT_2026331 [Mycena leptocephala]